MGTKIDGSDEIVPCQIVKRPVIMWSGDKLKTYRNFYESYSHQTCWEYMLEWGSTILKYHVI